MTPAEADPFEDMARLLSGFAVNAIVDGGAYIGTIAERLAGTFPGATVYAFEPQVESFRELDAMSARNGRVRAFPVALASTTRREVLHVGVLPYTSSLLERPRTGKPYYPAGAILDRSREIEAVSLDDWTRRRGLSAVDLIKLDVQGYELEVLSGARQLLQSTVKLVYLEVSFVPLYEKSCLFHDISLFLHECGFTLYRLYDLHHAENGQLIYADATFVSRQVRATTLT